MSTQLFRAGDIVKHAPSGETWTLANDQDGKYVSPAGWPRSMADAADCTLVEAASDEHRLETLRRWAGLTGDERDGNDHRISTAKPQLAALTA